jgi:hypothetical protein
MPRGSQPGTTPGPCVTCGRSRVWKADGRRATLGYWTCAHRDVAPRAPRVRAAPRPASRSAPRARSRPQGTQEWLSNPAVAACKHDACFWDAATCPVHRRRKKN